MAAILACLAFPCSLYHAWVVTNGKFFSTHHPSSSAGYYDRLADAFAHGQTYLLERPTVELLALPDPYDPRANSPYRLHDALLYHDRYYIYWGPVPAALLTPLKLLPERFQVAVPDRLLVLVFSLGLLWTLTALIFQVYTRLFPRAPAWIPIAGVLAAGCFHPLPYTLARPAVYEAAILGGQWFATLGMIAALVSFRGRPVFWLLAAASVCWGLAAGTRISLWPAVGLLGAITALAIRVHYQTLAPRVRALACATVLGPLALLAGIAGLYNKVRFDSFTDFGWTHQLDGFGVHGPAMSELMSTSFIWPSLLRYLFDAIELRAEFPFVAASQYRPAFMARFALPDLYNMEPVVGIVWAAPFLLLALIPPIQLLCAGRRADLRLRWLTAVLSAFAVLAVVPPLVMAGTTMRYQADGASAVLVLAVVGLLQWARANEAAGRSNDLLVAVAAPAWLVSLVLGMLLGMSGYDWAMQRENPELWQTLTGLFSTLHP